MAVDCGRSHTPDRAQSQAASVHLVRCSDHPLRPAGLQDLRFERRRRSSGTSHIPRIALSLNSSFLGVPAGRRGVCPIESYRDNTLCISKRSIDFGPPRPNVGEGLGVRGKHTDRDPHSVLRSSSRAEFLESIYQRGTPTPAVQSLSFRTGLPSQALEKIINEPARNADWWWQHWQPVNRVPSRILHLIPIDLELAFRMFSSKPDHQRMRKWPGLAAEVANITDTDSNFFLYLPLHSLFEGLARLHETRQDAIHLRRRLPGTGQQQFPATTYQHNDGGRQPRELQKPTLGTLSGTLTSQRVRVSATLTAEPVCPIPLDDLKGPARQRTKIFIKHHHC